MGCLLVSFSQEHAGPSSQNVKSHGFTAANRVWSPSQSSISCLTKEVWGCYLKSLYLCTWVRIWGLPCEQNTFEHVQLKVIDFKGKVIGPSGMCLARGQRLLFQRLKKQTWAPLGMLHFLHKVADERKGYFETILVYLPSRRLPVFRAHTNASQGLEVNEQQAWGPAGGQKLH